MKVEDVVEKESEFDDPNIDFASEDSLGVCSFTHHRRSGSPSCSDASRHTEWEDESPHPEVRAAVSNTDDMSMPVNTIRACTIGLLWSILIPGLNQFMNFRYPSITIGSVSL